MDENKLKAIANSPYTGCEIILTTKHQKSKALSLPFANILGANILEYTADTDNLGTFSGEIQRQGTALETAKQKCEWGLHANQAQYALASEGNFGPHPIIPFMPFSKELLYFIDKKNALHLCITEVYTKTNYQMQEISSYVQLTEFAAKALFPSHALIIRPFPQQTLQPIFKGIKTKEKLEEAFVEACKLSPKHTAWVETDMRAHFNPTRMQMINNLGEKLAYRLCCLCPKCATPGWGKVNVTAGLACGWCKMPTQEIKAEIFGCAKCNYQAPMAPAHGKDKADPTHCPNCNP